MEDPIEANGTVVAVHKGGLYRVLLDDDGREVLARRAGRLRRLRIVEGDKVNVEVSPYDPERGRIIRRLT
jgi:translation initiation factor IF-1